MSIVRISQLFYSQNLGIWFVNILRRDNFLPSVLSKYLHSGKCELFTFLTSSKIQRQTKQKACHPCFQILSTLTKSRQESYGYEDSHTEVLEYKIKLLQILGISLGSLMLTLEMSKSLSLIFLSWRTPWRNSQRSCLMSPVPVHDGNGGQTTKKPRGRLLTRNKLPNWQQQASRQSLLIRLRHYHIALNYRSSRESYFQFILSV